MNGGTDPLDQEILNMMHDRVRLLVFGIYSRMPAEDEGKSLIRVGGSGLLVAPSLALTARHVGQELHRTDANLCDYLMRRKGTFDLPYEVRLFQVPGSNGSPRAWEVSESLETPVTDIDVMRVCANDGGACGTDQAERLPYFEWSLSPPPVGSVVQMFGFPRSEIEVQPDGKLTFNVSYFLQESTVTEVFEGQRDRGMYRFPGFRMDRSVDHGFSGGPVIWNDRLCGIVSGGVMGQEGQGTYAASLWPLGLNGRTQPGRGTLPTGSALVQLLADEQIVRSEEWSNIQGRISVSEDAGGQAVACIAPERDDSRRRKRPDQVPEAQ
jgi:hypothetical protein